MYRIRLLAGKLAGLAALLGVLLLALLAGVFLSACEKRPGPATREAAETGPGPATAPATTRRAVDVDETRQGQPVPRNLLE